MIALAQAAGFVAEARSEINANPKDSHDHPEGVWTLPPSYRLGDVDKELYRGIGESDRMTLRFRKASRLRQIGLVAGGGRPDSVLD